MGTLSVSSYSAQPGDTITLYVNNLNHLEEYYINITINGYSKDLYGAYDADPMHYLDNMRTYDIPYDANGEMVCTLYTYNPLDDPLSVGDTIRDRIYVTVSSPNYNTLEINSFKLSPIILVQDITPVTLTATASNTGDGNISYYVFTDGYVSRTIYTSEYSASVDLPAPTSYGYKQYTVQVYNTYGESSTDSINAYVYQYSSPNFINFKAYRSNSSGTADINGLYITYEYEVSYASLDGTNTPTVTIICNNSTIKTVNGSSGKYTTTSTYNTSSQHSIYATVADTYGGSGTSAIVKIYPSGKILNISASGTGMGIGGNAPNKSGNLGCYWNADFYKDVNIDGNVSIGGNLVVDGTINNFTLPEIQTGTFTISDAVDYDGYYKINISFDKIFSSVPFVHVVDVSNDAYLEVDILKVISVSEYGCTIYIKGSEYMSSIVFHWVAIAA